MRHERAEAGVEAELITVTASTPGRGLHEQAEAQGADLIVVGSCSRGLLGRAMLGDDTRGGAERWDAVCGGRCGARLCDGGEAADADRRRL